jgi:menaquinone-dependent protoporphyrinogen oxidase
MQNKTLTRRKFLKTAALTLAAATLTCSGLGVAATLRPPIIPINETFGKDDMNNKRILVTYATRAGSTSEVAAVIGETLSRRGFSVDVKPVKDKPAVTSYQVVVMGSAIRMGAWLPEAVDYIRQNHAALNAMPVSLFTMHMLNAGEDETSRAARLGYLDAVRPLLSNAEEVFFTGTFDFSRLSFLDRMISKMVKAVEGDSRDWNKINAWANAIQI